MPSVEVSPEAFSRLALFLAHQGEQVGEATRSRQFRAHFGVSPLVRSIVWSMVLESLPHGAQPIHLLWALLFLKVYATEHVRKSMTGANEKTFRKWSWAILEATANLGVVSCFVVRFCLRHWLADHFLTSLLPFSAG